MAKHADSPLEPLASLQQSAHWYASAAARCLQEHQLSAALEYLDLAQNKALELAERVQL